MPVKYRKLFWVAVVLIAATYSISAFLPIRNRVKERSVVPAMVRNDKPPALTTSEDLNRKNSERFKVAGIPGDAIGPAESQAPNQQVEVEVITVRANGFDPREITRRQGAFMLAISNHTGATDLELHLDRVQGNRIHEVHLPKGRIRWNKVFDLPPGDYVLSEQNHPDWICRIKLTAH